MKGLTYLPLYGVILALSLCLVVTSAAQAEIYHWDVTQSGVFFWDVTNAWYPQLDIANTGKWPHAAGDVAVIMPDPNATQIFGNVQINMRNSHTVGDLTYAGSNNFLLVASGPVELYFVATNAPYSTVTFTNLMPTTDAGRFMGLYDGLLFVFSNDLHFVGHAAENPDNYIDAAEFDFGWSFGMWGNMHNVRMFGPVWLDIGTFAAGHNVRLRNIKEIALKGVWTRLFGKDYATVQAPMLMSSFYDCTYSFRRSTLILAGDEFAVNPTLSNAYAETWYSNWPGRTNTGDVAVHTFALIDVLRLTATSQDFYLELQGDVSGQGLLYKGYSNRESGILALTGSLSPGTPTEPVNLLHVYSPLGEKVLLGTDASPLDLNIDVTGLRSRFAVDADALVVENVSAVDLANINLNINNDARSNPYRTNEILFSFNNAFQGWFNSVSWSDPTREGVLIPGVDSIYVTGIPPLNSNFFDVIENRIVLVQGETQGVYTARTMFDPVDVTVTSSEEWVTTEEAYTLHSDVRTVAVQVPADQPTPLGYGLASSQLQIASVEDPETAYEVMVYVLQPGYYELNTERIYHLTGGESTYTINAYSPLDVDVDITIAQGAGWIAPDKTSLSLSDSREAVAVTVSDQPAGTEGIIRFSSPTNPALVHDVAVQVIDLGYFETDTTELEFLVGETQKTLRVSSPLAVNVSLASDEWITTPSLVELYFDAVDMPVIIPADQLEGETGEIVLQSVCFPSQEITVTVSVIPEPGVALSVLALAFLCGIRRYSV